MPDLTTAQSTFNTIIENRGKKLKDKIAYTFLLDGEKIEEHLTYGDLYKESKKIAVYLLSKLDKGDSVVLFYPYGLEFIKAFYGCLLAGIIAVPSYLPKPNRSFGRVNLIIDDSRAKAILSCGTVPNRKNIEDLAKSTNCEIIYTDKDINGEEKELPQVNLEDIAFIQYTSGSVSNPKGVVIRHRNIINNEISIKEAFGLNDESIVVGWLPFYHDMGLIGNIIQPVYSGFRAILMSPVHFLQKPVNWLKAISKYRATISGGPDFSYDLCVKNIDKEDVGEINLESWKVAFNGAEKINKSTLDRFYSKFKTIGFKKSSFTPCYGMAEATLLISSKRFGNKINIIKRTADELDLIGSGDIGYNNRENEIVSCGEVFSGKVIIVGANNQVQPEGRVGEILIYGESVFGGYWTENKEELSSFINIEGKMYFRTGDLGFVENGELYVTGRLKELLIINGRNYYPYDIENHLKQCIPEFDANIAVFTKRTDNDDAIIIVSECYYEIGMEPNRIFEKAVSEVFSEFNLTVASILLLRKGTLPRTTSGKVQRLSCRDLFLARKLDYFAQWPSKDKREHHLTFDIEPSYLNNREAEIFIQIQKFLDCQTLDINANLFTLGFDSIKITQLAGSISDKYRIDFPVDIFYKYSTIGEICKEISKLKRKEVTPLNKIRSGNFVELSSTQKAIWFDSQMKKGGTGYNLSAQVDFDYPVDAKILEQELKGIIEENDILRANFVIDGGEPKQVFNDKVAWYLDQVEPLQNSHEIEEWYDSFVKEQISTCFDLENDCLFRSYLIKKDSSGYTLLLVIHHIICDGSSLFILINEIRKRYQNRCSGISYKKINGHHSYTDFIVWEKSYIENNAIYAKKYWEEVLSGPIERLNLPYDTKVDGNKVSMGGAVSTFFDSDEKAGIINFSKTNQFTPNATLLASFFILVHKIAHQDDILLALPVANRQNKSFNNVLGTFINVVLIRGQITKDDTFCSILQKVNVGLANSLKYQSYPFGDVLKFINTGEKENVYSFTPIFYNNLSFIDGDNKYNIFDIFSGNENIETNIDLNFYIFQESDKFRIRFVYNKALFKASTVENLLMEFKRLTKNLVQNKDTEISKIHILPIKEISATELNKILRLGNGNPNTDYLNCENIVGLFKNQAASYGDRIAYKCDQESISYSELDRRSDILGQQILQAGSKKGDLIPLLLEKEIELPLSILAVWKSGCGFVPFDLSWPDKRINLLIDSINPPVVLVQEGSSKTLRGKHKKIVVSSDDIELDHKVFSDKISLDDIIYGIYTSGTTGTPKCAINFHKGILNRLLYMNKVYGYHDDDVVLFTSKQVFDASVWQMFWPLINAGRCIIPTTTRGVDIEEYVQLIHKEKVTVMDFVPSVFHIFVDYVEENNIGKEKIGTLRQLLIGGEAMNSKVVKRFRKILPNIGITNTYGPTEASIGTIFYEVGEDVPELIPIGKPIDNVKALILDHDLNPVPFGEKGDLYLGGVCLGGGYFNLPQKTSEVFLKNPVSGINSEFIYKTGDTAYYLDDGNIQYVGRDDNQVKINGIRVELKEIENCISLFPGIKETIVIFDKSEDKQNLVAYFTSEILISETDLKNYLRSNLPLYMVPSQLIGLDAFPITNVGKVDIRALPKPDIQNKLNCVPPETKMEIAVAKIWGNLFHVEYNKLDINTSFFEYGGHSLLALRLINEFNLKLKISLPLKSIFKFQTIKELSCELLKNAETKTLDIPIVPDSEYYPLSLQLENFFQNGGFDQKTRINLPVVFTINGKIDVDRFRQAFLSLIERHDSLRSSFHEVDGTYVVKVNKSPEFNMHVNSINDEDIKLKIQEFIKPFELTKAPLFRSELWISETRTYFLFDICHLITDAIGTAILFREFNELYKGNKLPEIPRRYIDYANWQKTGSFLRELDIAEKYWIERLKDYRYTELPNEGLKISEESFYGSEALILDKKTADEIAMLSKEKNISKFFFMMSLINLSIGEETGFPDVTLGLRLSVRNESFFENIVGFFLNKLLIRYQFGEETINEYLINYCNFLMEDLNNGHYPYELLREKIEKISPLQSKLMNIMINYYPPVDKNFLNFEEGISIQEEKIVPRYENKLLKYDIDLSIKDVDTKIIIDVVYNSDKYSAQKIKKLLNNIPGYLKILKEKPDQKLVNLNQKAC